MIRPSLALTVVPFLASALACRNAPRAAPPRADSTPQRVPVVESDAGDEGAPTATSAPGTGGIELYDAARLDAVSAALARAGSTGRTIGGHPTFHYVQSRRTTTGSAEVHARWADVTLVQAGRASLLSGGTVQGGASTGAGERRGGTIAGGSTQRIAAGDLFVVPAGVPHQFLVARGDSIRYLTIKVASPAP